MRIIVSYDVVSDRRRRRLAKRLAGHLERVQQSVFEGEIDRRRLERVRRLVSREIDHAEDSVRIYHLCARCRPATEVMGTGPWISESQEDVLI